MWCNSEQSLRCIFVVCCRWCSCYTAQIRKKANINIKNNDDRCLMWALLSALHPVEQHAERVSKYTQYVEELRFDGVMFPATLRDVSKVEIQNGLAINVFGYEGNLYPLYLSERQETPINLLLHDDHFTWIKKLQSCMRE